MIVVEDPTALWLEQCSKSFPGTPSVQRTWAAALTWAGLRYVLTRDESWSLICGIGREKKLKPWEMIPLGHKNIPGPRESARDANSSTPLSLC